jgi:hypothetical protein
LQLSLHQGDGIDEPLNVACSSSVKTARGALEDGGNPLLLDLDGLQ